jgi:integrase
MAEVYIRSRGGSASRRFQEFLTKSGIGTQEGKATIKGFHSFRHFFATKAKEAGVDQAALREILGWSSSAMERVYSHVGDEYVISSMRKMEGVMNGQSQQKNNSNAQVSALSDAQLTAQLAAIQAELDRRQK